MTAPTGRQDEIAATPMVAFRAQRWHWPRAALWPHVVLLALASAVLVPLAFLILGSFSTARIPTQLSWSTIGLANYAAIWLDPQTYRLLLNTAAFVLGATALGVALAALLAWLVERTNVPGKAWLYAGIPLTLAVPGLLQAMAWVLLLSPKSGFVNRALMDWWGLSAAPINVYSLSGMAFVEGIHLVPTAFLMLVPLLRTMDPALEEAASIAGASPVSILRRVTVKLMLPGLVAVSIYQTMTALEVFEIPGVLGMPVGLHVFATKIYAMLQSATGVPVYGQASALGILYLLLGMIAAGLYWRMVRRSERYTVVSGKAYRPRTVDLGPWRWLALGIIALYFFLAIVLPFVVMLYISFVPYLQQPSLAVLETLTWKHYDFLLSYPKFTETFWNTLTMAALTATATTIASFAIALVVVRSKFWGRRLVDQLAFMPHAIPGIVAGLAFLWLFLVIGLFGTILSIVLAFSVTFIAYGSRAMSAAILQLHRDLEEAARVAGAAPLRVMARVFFPLMLPAFVGLWIWVVLLAVRIAGLPLVLYEGPRNQVLAVLIWKMWDDGDIEAVGAIGVLLMVALFLLALLLRLIGFRRAAA
ncbi:MAG TPA: ABC transporter permease subunit [Stellaceae bacterium]|nr:ABC transporter permease subunit [Stellaceae bacterium]